MDLVFQLERGGSDAFKRPPVVWRVDEPFQLSSLQRRFAQDWAPWYGPALSIHAAAIGRQLAAPAAWCFDAGPGHEAAPSALARWWAMPVVRRRPRRLRIALAPPADGLEPGWPISDRMAWPVAHRRGLALSLSLHQFWGAASDQALQPGPAVWCDCPERVPTRALQLPSLALTATDRVAGQPGEGAQRLEHRLHDGIGLLVLLPRLSARPVADTLGAGGAHEG